MKRHIENAGIVRTVYSRIFRHIQGHSAIFGHGQIYWGTLRHTEVYSDISEAYWAIFRHIQNSELVRVQLCHIHNPGILYLEPEGSYLEPCHCQKSLFKYFQRYLGTFRDIDAYSSTIIDVQLGNGVENASLALFWKSKKLYWFWIKFSIQNVVLLPSRRKSSEMFPCGVFFCCVFDDMFIEVPYFHETSWKIAY